MQHICLCSFFCVEREFTQMLCMLCAVYIHFMCITNVLVYKIQNPFLSNFIKLATVSERQAPPIHARPSLCLT